MVSLLGEEERQGGRDGDGGTGGRQAGRDEGRDEGREAMTEGGGTQGQRDEDRN